MGQSIGELFVSIGLDFDEDKLKKLDDGINNITSSLDKLTVNANTALNETFNIFSKSANLATSMENFSMASGMAVENIQRFIGAAKELNPLLSDQSAFTILQRLEEYRQALRTGGATANWLEQFGGTYNAQQGTQQLLEQYIAAAERAKNDPRLRGFLPQLAKEGFGTTDVLPFLNATVEQRQQSGDNFLFDTKRNAEFNKNIAELGNRFMVLMEKLTNEVAPNLINAFTALNNVIDMLINNKVFKLLNPQTYYDYGHDVVGPFIKKAIDDDYYAHHPEEKRPGGDQSYEEPGLTPEEVNRRKLEYLFENDIDNSSQQSSNTSIQQNNNITVNGANDPQDTADHVTGSLQRAFNQAGASIKTDGY